MTYMQKHLKAEAERLTQERIHASEALARDANDEDAATGHFVRHAILSASIAYVDQTVRMLQNAERGAQC